MTFERFLRNVETAKRLHPIWFEIDTDDIPEEAEIERAQDGVGVIFPVEYKQFLRHFGGGYFAFTNIFSVQRGSVWNIVERNHDMIIVPEFIAISDNGVGDHYGFRAHNGACSSGLALRDHETGTITDTFPDLFVYLTKLGLREGIDDR